MRLIDDAVGVLDVLVDTTCISTNPHFLGIVVKAKNKGLALDIAYGLSEGLQNCPIVFDFEEPKTKI